MTYTWKKAKKVKTLNQSTASQTTDVDWGDFRVIV